MDTLRQHKTTIQDILATDSTRILSEVFSSGLITEREYNNMGSINKGTAEDIAREIVDKVMFKGKASEFIDFLKEESIIEICPQLKNMAWDVLTVSSSSKPSADSHSSIDAPESKIPKKDDSYPLSSKPTGLCVIINNEKFQVGTERRGTEKDAEDLAAVFSGLGFQVLMCKDQTKRDMVRVTKLLAALEDLTGLQECRLEEWSCSSTAPLSQLPRHGDAFVCCVLSHGDKGVVHGVDRAPLSIEDLTSTFNGKHCPALLGKPKVFFIQACQGTQLQSGLEEVDGGGGPPVVLIPSGADFLVAMATIGNYQAVRHPENGSWFIQSLCAMLREGSLRGDDIMQILYRVNNDVSQKTISTNGALMTQMPGVELTLRRRLVFKPSSS